MKQAVIDIGSNSMRLTVPWSAPANGLQTAYKPITGFALWARTSNPDDTEIILRLPKQENSYHYHDASDQPLNQSVTIDRPTNYYKLADNHDEPINVDHASQQNNIVFIGNPFLTELYSEPFFQRNTQLTGNFWVYREGMLEAHSVHSNLNISATSIQPLEGFLAELKDNVTFSYDELLFLTEDTYASSLNEPTRVQNNTIATPQLQIEAKHGNSKSTIHIIEDNQALNGYNPYEDVTLLMLDSAMTPAAIYTIADNKALQLNKLKELSWLPINITYATSLMNATSMTLSFKGIDNFESPLYLMDSELQQRYLLTNNMELTLELPNSNALRYYIYKMPINDTAIPETNNCGIICFNPSPNHLTVLATDNIENITIYNSIGQQVYQALEIRAPLHNTTLSQGSYVIMIKTRLDQRTQKIIIQ